jgi:hypothetical protein
VQEDYTLRVNWELTGGDQKLAQFSQEMSLQLARSTESIRDRMKRYIFKLSADDEYKILEACNQNPNQYIHWKVNPDTGEKEIFKIGVHAPGLKCGPLQASAAEIINRNLNRQFVTVRPTPFLLGPGDHSEDFSREDEILGVKRWASNSHSGDCDFTGRKKLKINDEECDPMEKELVRDIELILQLMRDKELPEYRKPDILARMVKLLGETFEVDVKEIVLCMIFNSDDAKVACNGESQGGEGGEGGAEEDSEIVGENAAENLDDGDV